MASWLRRTLLLQRFEQQMVKEIQASWKQDFYATVSYGNMLQLLPVSEHEKAKSKLNNSVEEK